MTEEHIKKASLQEIRRMRDNGETGGSKDTVIEDAAFSHEFWKDAEISESIKRRSVHLKLKPDVFEYFKKGGRGHVTRMQDVLTAYVKAQKAARP